MSFFSNNPPKEFLQIYTSFTNKHGNLFVQKMAPMTEADLAPVIKNDRFTRKITFPVFISFAIAASCFSLYLFITAQWLYAVGILMASVGLIFFAYYLKTYYAELLNQKEKIILTGIVFRKRKLRDSILISISDQLEIVVEDEDAKKLRLGDVVEIECLSLERYIKNSVLIKGSISELSK